MAEDELVRRILSEADMAARPGQYDRLVAIANEVAALREDFASAMALVAALREQYVVEEFIDTDGYPSMRVVKGEHVGQNEWAADIRREVLADLRAKVTAYKQELLEDTIPIDGPLTPTSQTCCTLQLDHVLALIEEADRG